MKTTQLTLPALRGNFGDWIYYSCVIPLEELGKRVSYAEEIHPDKALSQLIQRSLEGPRAKHIASYLQTKDRFFNSLVLATYGGSPDWLEVGDFRSTSDPDLVGEIADNLIDSIGFLRLSGKERIFAVDGQHRLAGIKKALDVGLDNPTELVPIILVGHKKSAQGLQRTRRLFTTLNKTAVPVRKKDIIALDEDDVMAITARQLVESHNWFRSPKIAVIGSQNLPSSNDESLTTIANLYDVLKILFRHKIGQHSDRSLRFNRPSDEKLEEYYAYALQYFGALASHFSQVRKLFESTNPRASVRANRGPKGGHLLFRPVGLDAFTRAAVAYSEWASIPIGISVERLRSMPMNLAEEPHRDVLWDPRRKRMLVRGKGLSVRLMSYMAGIETDTASLLTEYRVCLGVDADDQSIQLPQRL